MKSSFPKVVVKSLNIFEQFQVLVKLQGLSCTKHYHHMKNPIRSKTELFGAVVDRKFVKGT